ncbi:MAG: toxin-antitoxin system TumE family protein [Desulfobacterales bacterium]|jgi:hypothetical protein
MATIVDLKRIAEVEFFDIVKESFMITCKLRIILIDNSFIDVNLSKSLPGKFGFHWECRDAAGAVFRYDNFPDKSWKNVSTFPYHFHKGSQKNVTSSPFPLAVIDGFRAFMEFVRSKVKK